MLEMTFFEGPQTWGGESLCCTNFAGENLSVFDVKHDLSQCSDFSGTYLYIQKILETSRNTWRKQHSNLVFHSDTRLQHAAVLRARNGLSQNSAPRCSDQFETQILWSWSRRQFVNMVQGKTDLYLNNSYFGCMYVCIYIYISKYVQAQSHLNLHTYSTIPNDILQARSFRPQWKHCLFQTEAISNKQTNTTQVHTLSNNHGNEDMAKQKNYPWREPLPWLFGVLATGCNWHFPPLAPPKQLQHQPFSFLVWLYTLYSKDIWNWFIYIYI